MTVRQHEQCSGVQLIKQEQHDELMQSHKLRKRRESSSPHRRGNVDVRQEDGGAGVYVVGHMTRLSH